jgi:hypothetical protein
LLDLIFLIADELNSISVTYYLRSWSENGFAWAR